VSAGHLAGQFSRAFDVLSEPGTTILVFGAMSSTQGFRPLLEERQFPWALVIGALSAENLCSLEELLAFSKEIFEVCLTWPSCLAILELFTIFSSLCAFSVLPELEIRDLGQSAFDLEDMSEMSEATLSTLSRSYCRSLFT